MRRLGDRLFTVATGACAALASLLLMGIVASLLWRGLPALEWSFLVRASGEAGASGGVLYQLLGTLILVLTACLVSSPLALALALWRGVYLESPAARRRLSAFLYTVNGVPSVLFGIFGLLLFVRYLDWGKSWLAGGILLGMMILPTVAVSLAEHVERIPRKYLEGAAALGMSRGQIVRAVILPQSLGGLISGSLLGLARAAGETAPILFAAAIFSGVTLPKGIVESPVLALPYHIFILAQDSFAPGTEPRLWAAATVLLSLVLLLSALALPARLRLHEEAGRG